MEMLALQTPLFLLSPSQQVQLHFNMGGLYVIKLEVIKQTV